MNHFLLMGYKEKLIHISEIKKFTLPLNRKIHPLIKLNAPFMCLNF